MDRYRSSKAQMQPGRKDQTEYGTHRARDAIQGAEPHAPMRRHSAKQDQFALKTKGRQHVAENAGDEDYIQQWLNQSVNQIVPLVISSRRQEGSSRSQEGERRHPKPDNFKAFHLNGIDEQTQTPLVRHRRRRNSSSSSLLELGIQPRNHEKKEVKPQQLLKSPPRKRRKCSQLTSTSDMSDVPRPPNEVFEKRLRHKTLETRYEPKIKGDESKKPAKSRPKRQKRGDRSKAGRKDGEALMQNFSSKSIAHERLTMQPSHSHGLFHKGRASSLYGKRGIPDLAFSEMDFLRHSSKQALGIEDENLAYKSRQKEKRAVQRAQDEITSFFNTSKPQPQKGGSQVEVSQPKYSHELSNCSSGRERSSRYQHSLSRSPGQSSNMLGLQYLGFGRPGPSPERPLVPCRPEIFKSQKGSERIGSASTQCAHDMSEVSWSESMRNPSKVEQRKTGRADVRTERSVTPETIRRSLDKTGIFRDTGIQRTSILERHSFSTPSRSMLHDAMENQEPNLEQAAAGRFSSDTEVSNPGDQRRPNIRTDPNTRAYAAQLIASFRHKVGAGAQDISYADTTQEKPQKEVGISKMPLVEYYNPKNGWSEDPRIVTNVKTANRSDPSEFRPLSREESAKKAYVVRPPLKTTPRNYVTGSVAIETSQGAKELPTEKLLGKELDIPADAIVQNSPVRRAQDNNLGRDTIQDDPKLASGPSKTMSVASVMPAYTEDISESTVRQKQTAAEPVEGVDAKVQDPPVEYRETQPNSSLSIRGFSSKQIIQPKSQHRVLTPAESVAPMYQQQMHAVPSQEGAQRHGCVQHYHLFGNDPLYARSVSKEQEAHDPMYVECTNDYENLELEAAEYEILENDLNHNHYEVYGQQYERGHIQQLADDYSPNCTPDYEERIASHFQPAQSHRNSDYSSNTPEAMHDDEQGDDLGSGEQEMNSFWKPFRRY